MARHQTTSFTALGGWDLHFGWSAKGLGVWAVKRLALNHWRAIRGECAEVMAEHGLVGAIRWGNADVPNEVRSFALSLLDRILSHDSTDLRRIG